MAPVKIRGPLLLLGGMLGLLTAFAYWRVTSYGFIGLDDPKYLLENSHVNTGLTWSGLVWAFTSGYASNWHPLTWLSHMLDCELYGLHPGGHHLTNLLFHTVNTLLLFFLLTRLTNSFWRSALVAALFAWHPTHVESVAWAAERKDVLSTFFFLLTLWCYVRYVLVSEEQQSIVRDQVTADESTEWTSNTRLTESNVHSSIEKRKPKIKNSPTCHYWLALFLFTLGLMSKPMLVTLPFVLLLLDYWPLRRLSAPSLRRSITPLFGLLREKLPFFALSVLASLVTFFVQKAGGAVSSLTTLPFGARLANALVAYVRYLSNTVWPAGLSVFYPIPDHWPLLTVVASGLVLLGVSWLVLRKAGQFPFLPLGWFWFLGTLVPTIGLVQVGSQSMADRYFYIPSIGLFIIAAWGLNEFTQHLSLFVKRPSEEHSATLAEGLPATLPLPVRDRRGEGNSYASERTQSEKVRVTRFAPTLAAVMALIGCLACTSRQIRYWHDEETLFRHAMEVTQDNYLAYDHLAKVCENAGRKEEALTYYTQLLELKPRYPEGQYNLGTLLLGIGKPAEAEEHLQAAVLLRPGWAQAYSNLGIAQFRQNKLEEARNHLQTAARLDSQTPDTYVNLGVTFLAMNRPRDAGEAFKEALHLNQAAPESEFLLALALSREPKPAEASVRAQRARDLALASGQKELAAKASELLRLCEASQEVPKGP